MQKRKRIKLGDIISIPLPDNTFAFGRIYKDAAIAIYKETKESIEDVPSNEEYQFIVGIYNQALRSDGWEVVASRPFENEEDAWPPPSCVIDSISGEYSIYHKGHMRPSTEKECQGLEVTAVWAANHIVDRIMGIDKWHKR